MRFALFLLVPAAFGHEIITTRLTWSAEISRVFYRRCMECHGPRAAIPLTTYEEVRPWAVAIREEVTARRMPPWDAVRGFGEFDRDASLTAVEMERIVQWVEGGAPRGNPVYLEKLPLDLPVSAPREGGGFAVRGRYVARRQMTVYGLEARGAVQVVVREGGSVRPLLWVPEFRVRRVYWLREPVVLEAGAALEASGEVWVVTRRVE